MPDPHAGVRKVKRTKEEKLARREKKRRKAEKAGARAHTVEATAPPLPPSLASSTPLPPLSALRAQFAASQPYLHIQLHDVFGDAALRAVRAELSSLHRTFKETDLFKVWQTGDLGNLDAADATHAAALPATIALRDALYTPAFRAFVRRVTGCAPLTGQTDCSCNVYARGGHLLCHDDVIGTRCVSYILYLSRPGRQWEPSLGGALELYACNADGEPQPAPSACVPPEFGSMVLFAVQPGRSFHAVQEQLGAQPRLAISGWFHARAPPAGAETAATLAQLERRSGGCDDPWASRAWPSAAGGAAPALSEADVRKLAPHVNRAYLTAAAAAAVRAQLAAEGAAQLADFRAPRLAAPLLRAAAAADASDHAAAGGGGGGPDYSTGLHRRGWRVVGPPQFQRFLAHGTRTDDDGDGGDGEDGDGGDGDGGDDGAAGTVGARLEKVRALMRAPAFARLIGALSGLAPRRCRSVVRRFRRGLDYTLAHVGTLADAPVVDATLAFVPPPPKSGARGGAAAARAWDSGDVGGFECFVRKEGDGAAAEVYRADDASAGVTSVHPVSNALVLALRQPDTMKFVKFVGAAAPGSRWDVAVEYHQS